MDNTAHIVHWPPHASRRQAARMPAICLHFTSYAFNDFEVDAPFSALLIMRSAISRRAFTYRQYEIFTCARLPTMARRRGLLLDLIFIISPPPLRTASNTFMRSIFFKDGHVEGLCRFTMSASRVDSRDEFDFEESSFTAPFAIMGYLRPSERYACAEFRLSACNLYATLCEAPMMGCQAYLYLLRL